MSNDITIQQAGSHNTNVNIRPHPAHLITTSIFSTGNKKYFISLKLDKGPYFVDTTGFFPVQEKGQRTLTEKDIIDTYRTLLEKTLQTPEKIIEISLPWNKIDLIQSLVFKHKGSK